MRLIALASAALALFSGQGGEREPIRLKIGDTVSVTSPYGGEFKIMPDGAIYGKGFGRLALEGKSWDQAQIDMRKALKKFVREDEVYLTLKELRREVVYMVGMGGGKGAVELVPNLTLRQLLASAPLDGDADQVQTQIFRHGTKQFECNVASLLAGSGEDQKLLADDVVALVPTPFMRIWVTGYVARPGQFRVPADTDVHRAVAQAGGLRWPELITDTNLEKEARIVVHRGPETFELPVGPSLDGHSFALEAGDTVTVVAPEEYRVTVAGEIVRPGEVTLRGQHTLNAAIALAGGCGPEGTLNNVLVMRKGELFRINAAVPAGNKPFSPFQIESGDLIHVQRNERAFIVLGEVAKAGRVLMKDDKDYRLSDALASAEGLSAKGTLRRVYLSRADANGKMKVTQFNLDEYFKDGKLESNPEVVSGDCILFGQPKGFSTAAIGQILSSALLFESITGGKP